MESRFPALDVVCLGSSELSLGKRSISPKSARTKNDKALFGATAVMPAAARHKML